MNNKVKCISEIKRRNTEDKESRHFLDKVSFTEKTWSAGPFEKEYNNILHDVPYQKFQVTALTVIAYLSIYIIYRNSEYISNSAVTLLKIIALLLLVAYIVMMKAIFSNEKKALSRVACNKLMNLYIFEYKDYVNSLNCSDSHNYDSVYTDNKIAILVDKHNYELAVQVLREDPSLRNKLGINDSKFLSLMIEKYESDSRVV